jgi:hypothetical protein
VNRPARAACAATTSLLNRVDREGGGGRHHCSVETSCAPPFGWSVVWLVACVRQRVPSANLRCVFKRENAIEMKDLIEFHVNSIFSLKAEAAGAPAS